MDNFVIVTYYKHVQVLRREKQHPVMDGFKQPVNGLRVCASINCEIRREIAGSNSIKRDWSCQGDRDCDARVNGRLEMNRLASVLVVLRGCLFLDLL